MLGVRSILFLAILAWTSVSNTTLAIGRTWLVERDGSGDFTIIQDAVDAAASGDTVRIGPGRFDEKQYVTCPGWSDSVRVLVTKQELTLVGSGVETIIGQSNSWENGQGEHRGIVASDYWGCSVIRIENLRIENMYHGVYTSHEVSSDYSIEIANCSFNANCKSVVLLGAGGVVRIDACVFNDVVNSGTHVLGGYHSSMELRGCVFELSDFAYGEECVAVNGVDSATIVECDFIGGTGGVSVVFGEAALLNCTFDGQQNTAFTPGPGASVTVDSCTFRNQSIIAASGHTGNQLTIDNSSIENVSDCAFLIAFFGSLSVNGCDLAKGERGVVWVTDEPTSSIVEHLDFTNNYWGTDNPDSIQAWIRDRNDSEDARYFIDWEPYSDVPLPTEKKTMGGLKAMFRSGR